MPPAIAQVNITFRYGLDYVVLARPETYDELKELAYTTFQIPREVLLDLTGIFAGTGFVELDSSTYGLVHESATISIFFVYSQAMALAYPEMVARHWAVVEQVHSILLREAARLELGPQEMATLRNALYDEAALKDEAARQKLITGTENAVHQKEIASAEDTVRAMTGSVKQEQPDA